MERCRLHAASAASTMLDAGCTRLARLELTELQSGAPWDVQLMQLGRLPGLTAVALDASCGAALFLCTLGKQLTALELDSDCRRHVAGGRAAPQWAALLRHAAQCTALQSLTVPCVTAAELRAVAPALAQLRHLQLNHEFDEAHERQDGDALVEVLLGLTQLTSLVWDDASPYALRRSHVGRRCGWRQLEFGGVAPHQLARLPVASLAGPVMLNGLVFDGGSSVDEVAAAAAHVVGDGKPGLRWRQADDGSWSSLFFTPPPPSAAAGEGSEEDEAEDSESALFSHGASEEDTAAALVRAARPLLASGHPQLARLNVHDASWDVELVRALGEALPAACAALAVRSGRLPAPALFELALRLPGLAELRLEDVQARCWPLRWYLGRAACAGGRGGGLRRLLVQRPEALDDEEEQGEEDGDAWYALQDEVERLGLGVEVAVEM